MSNCSEKQIYVLSMLKLKGVCVSLEEAGYTVLDQDRLEIFSGLYGPLIQNESSDFLSLSSLSLPQKILGNTSTEASSGPLWLFNLMPDLQALLAHIMTFLPKNIRFNLCCFSLGTVLLKI